MTFATVLAEEVAKQQLILPIWAFPTIAALFFIVGAIIVFTYRDVANRHSNKTQGDEAHDDHSEHGGHGH